MRKRLTLLNILCLSLTLLLIASCSRSTNKQKAISEAPFLWENANIYFLLTDRFHNGDHSNDLNFERSDETAVLRGFQGGDIAGVIKKLEDGYFKELGQFRKEHPSVGAGKHQMISTEPYLFTRHYTKEDYSDQVLVGLDMTKGEKTIKVENLFAEGSKLYDYYSERADQDAGKQR